MAEPNVEQGALDRGAIQLAHLAHMETQGTGHDKTEAAVRGYLFGLANRKPFGSSGDLWSYQGDPEDGGRWPVTTHDQAIFAGAACPLCDHPIERGDRVVPRHGDWVHRACYERTHE